MPQVSTKKNAPKKNAKQESNSSAEKNRSSAENPSRSVEENGAATSQKGKTSRKKEAEPQREVLYPKISARICVGDAALKYDDCKELLGWHKPPEGVKEGTFQVGEERVFLTNNVKNRPIYDGVVETLTQEHLRKRWRFNGEPIIIGKTGLVLNGQHTLLSLVRAVDIWREKQGQYQGTCPTEPTMEKMIVFGIDETDDVVNTMDTCKPRSLADVIYRSEYFSKLKQKDRKIVSKLTADAIKLLWHRTGAFLDAFAPRRTHAESLDFISRHQKILKCIKHVYTENGSDNKIGRYLSPGYAAAMMYLMASSASERETEDKKGYHQVDTPSEKQLDFSLWDDAESFFVLLAGGDERLQIVRDTLAEMLENGSGSIAERCALLAKTWNTLREGDELTKADLLPAYETNQETGERELAEHPSVGGIDLGNPKI